MAIASTPYCPPEPTHCLPSVGQVEVSNLAADALGMAIADQTKTKTIDTIKRCIELSPNRLGTLQY
ncbi:MAG: hypothetical protein HC895_18600 [Leptolyngbyaceae cyanobacterium SM1_3_5]|nr:hypothetical protein [Leptolyngbyaceae cyanobacterium SM1_3_5]